MKSVMSHQFSQVPTADIQRSVFNRSHTYKTTFDAGYLIPFYVDEYLPGDTFNVDVTIFARLNTPISPIMDNLTLTTFYFAVPNRLVWTNFVKMCGERTDPSDSISYTVPQIVSPSGGWAVGTIYDYFGLPTSDDIGVGNTISINALPLRAYNLIYNEWFRDQNIIDSEANNTGNGPDTHTDYGLLRRGKRHDYFTSCLPWAQKGTEVTVDLGGTAPVLGLGTTAAANYSTARTLYESDLGTESYSYVRTLNTGGNDFYVAGTASTSGYPNIHADLSGASGMSLADFRESVATQHFLEAEARGGSRYTEIVLSMFGVRSADARLQRPEYLGGKTSPIIISQVPQTSETNTTAQGTLAAYGTVTHTKDGFTKSFTEHGHIIGLMCVDADLTYQQGIDRMWSRSDRYDFYWPAFAHLSEQPVLNQEIYADGSSNDTSTFGYQERYAEYRYKPSKITGKLRSTYTTSLDTWHLSEEFSSLPSLNQTFIESNPPIDRVVASSTEPDFTMDSYIQNKTVRPLPVFAIPGLEKM
jgi:hypothetical protein